MDRIEKKDFYKLEDNDFDNQDSDITTDSFDSDDKIHDIIYDTIIEIKSYIVDNNLPMLDSFKYVDFFILIGEQITF